MGILFFKAKAKINLNLHLLPELSDKGYYPVKFLNSQLDIYDRVRIAINDKKKINLSLLCENKAMNSHSFKIEEGENIAYRAAELIKDEYGIKSGIDIEIKKNIPIKAGLGGGSCDAAAVINGMDKLFSLNLSISQKIKLAEKLGMDVCYCVVGGLCLVGGIGNIILPLPYPIPKIENILLVLPTDEKPSTAWAYSIVKKENIGKNLDKLQGIIAGILTRDIGLICENIWNDFEEPVSEHYPAVRDIINGLKQMGACAATVAGSGLTVFGIFKDRDKMLNAERSLKAHGFKCIKTSIN